MANLYIAFSRVSGRPAVPPQVAQGRNQRTETIEIPTTTAGETTSALSAQATDNIVWLYAEANCWVEIGSSPEAEAVAAGGSGTSFFLPSSTPMPYGVQEGDKISVVEA